MNDASSLIYSTLKTLAAKQEGGKLTLQNPHELELLVDLNLTKELKLDVRLVKTVAYELFYISYLSIDWIELFDALVKDNLVFVPSNYVYPYTSKSDNVPSLVLVPSNFKGSKAA